MINPSEFNAPEELTAADILSLVRMHLPAWTRACEASDMDGIALHESEFGTSSTELLLFACAIKFAAGKGKNVHVLCGNSMERQAGTIPSTPLPVFRETLRQTQTKVARQRKRKTVAKRRVQ
jgi:hypothetical protein